VIYPAFLNNGVTIVAPQSLGSAGQALFSLGDGTADWQTVTVDWSAIANKPNTFLPSGTGLVSVTDGKPDAPTTLLARLAADAAAARTAILAASTSTGLSQFPAASTTSDQLAAVLTDETGSGGGFVRATGPTIASPTLTGTATASNLNASGTFKLVGAWFGTDTFDFSARRIDVSAYSSAISLGSTTALVWETGAWIAGSKSVGFIPSATGVLKVTNGSTGYGAVQVGSPNVTTPAMSLRRVVSQTAPILNVLAEDGSTSLASISSSGAVTATQLLLSAGSSPLLSMREGGSQCEMLRYAGSFAYIGPSGNTNGVYVGQHDGTDGRLFINSASTTVGNVSQILANSLTNRLIVHGSICLGNPFTNLGNLEGKEFRISASDTSGDQPSWRGATLAIQAGGARPGMVANIPGSPLILRGGQSIGNQPGGPVRIQATAPGSSGNLANTYVTVAEFAAGQATVTVPLAASGTVSVGTYTVATLPSASANAGAFAQVTDSNSTTNGAIVAGGGSNRVPVFASNGNWIIK
jgi:hypothetical protein